MTLDRIFSPISIGTMKLDNRIVMPPMATNFASPEGFPTDRLIAYYRERARGGVGYLNTEHTGILLQGKASANMLMISSDEHIMPMRRLVDAVHEAMGKIVVQINHAGRQTSSAVTKMPIVAPSPIPVTEAAETPCELAIPEIEGIVEAFAAAAERVQKAGADGVELHMAHGYLLCSFLSPFSNRRTDAYGGDLPRRSRLAIEVLRAVRRRVGRDYPVVCRLSGDEYVEGGLKIDETCRIASLLEENGADALHISACNAASGYLNHPPYYVQECVFVPLAEAVKAAVRIPVITVGRIKDPLKADRIIREGKADLVSMGRALIADPHLPEKARTGRFDEITPCISCNRCVQYFRKGGMRCAVNPEAGYEETFRFVKAASPKKIWIAGGGPGGLKTAEIAAQRGHRVTLFEKTLQLGGKMRLAAVPPKKEGLLDFIDYLERRVKASGVKIELDMSLTASHVEEGKPDAVIIATGALPIRPNWPGIEESGAISVEDLLSRKPAQIGQRVLIIGAGGAGSEAADYLSEMGRKVTLIEMLDSIAAELVTHLQHYLKLRLKTQGVQVMTSTRVKALGRGSAIIEDKDGERRIDGFDTIVIAAGWKPDQDLLMSLRDKVPELYVIGDASKPREALEAVFEGEQLAVAI
ncbi:MAG: FAD-dependent oxidoreductase [Deltaproteobacteria bacterium]|nr:FAD-dependent oxidoreductase [Deltaproteobacteria bacterium]